MNNDTNNEWTLCSQSLPPEGVEVEITWRIRSNPPTNGIEEVVKRKGSSYLYKGKDIAWGEPTHWRHKAEAKPAGSLDQFKSCPGCPNPLACGDLGECWHTGNKPAPPPDASKEAPEEEFRAIIENWDPLTSDERKSINDYFWSHFPPPPDAHLATVTEGPSDEENLIDEVAFYLCELEHDDPHQMVYEGGAIPEPWGEVWQKFTPDANELLKWIKPIIYRLSFAPVIAKLKAAHESMTKDRDSWEQQSDMHATDAAKYLGELEKVKSAPKDWPKIEEAAEIIDNADRDSVTDEVFDLFTARHNAIVKHTVDQMWINHTAATTELQRRLDEAGKLIAEAGQAYAATSGIVRSQISYDWRLKSALAKLQAWEGRK